SKAAPETEPLLPRALRAGQGLLDASRDLLNSVANALSRTMLARYISGSLLRRILISNLIGLVILLGGVLYLTTTHGWLLEAKRQSLQKQGQII
ncbi:sensor N-terminal transmembrane domain-containing protein, partial [Klebsiella pneumoniae]